VDLAEGGRVGRGRGWGWGWGRDRAGAVGAGSEPERPVTYPCNLLRVLLRPAAD
jgi:hypothetical protein